MGVLFLTAVTIGICLLVSFRHRVWRAGSDEEFTRAAEPYAIASVLGCGETRTTCHIIYGSNSEMRISVMRSLPPDAQINVEWENQFFVGTIRDARVRGAEQILSLRVVSTNRR